MLGNLPPASNHGAGGGEVVPGVVAGKDPALSPGGSHGLGVCGIGGVRIRVDRAGVGGLGVLAARGVGGRHGRLGNLGIRSALGGFRVGGVGGTKVKDAHLLLVRLRGLLGHGVCQGQGRAQGKRGAQGHGKERARAGGSALSDALLLSRFEKMCIGGVMIGLRAGCPYLKG